MWFQAKLSLKCEGLSTQYTSKPLLAMMKYNPYINKVVPSRTQMCVCVLARVCVRACVCVLPMLINHAVFIMHDTRMGYSFMPKYCFFCTWIIKNEENKKKWIPHLAKIKSCSLGKLVLAGIKPA